MTEGITKDTLDLDRARQKRRAAQEAGKAPFDLEIEVAIADLVRRAARVTHDGVDLDELFADIDEYKLVNKAVS